jgi:hypothetical protein
VLKDKQTRLCGKKEWRHEEKVGERERGRKEGRKERKKFLISFFPRLQSHTTSLLQN